MKTILDPAGRIELPLIVQKQLGLQPGDAVMLEADKGRWIIVPASLPVPCESIESSDELDWANLQYDSVPLKSAGRLKARVSHQGDLEPLPVDQDD